MLLTRNYPAEKLLRNGTVALFGGVLLTLLAITSASLPLFFLGGAVAGAGFGGGFQGAIRAVLPLAHPTERAAVLSVLYVIAYLAMGLPAVLGGIRVVHGGGVLVTAREYGLGVMALAALAFLGSVWRKPAEAASLVVGTQAPRSERKSRGFDDHKPRHRASKPSASW